MSTLLHLDSSPLGTSISRALTREYVKIWKNSDPSGTVIYRDLAANPPSPLGRDWIYASFTPEGSRTPEQKAALSLSDELIGELERADEYVFGVAMQDFSIPSVFKLWIDQTCRVGKTLGFTEAGPQGLLHGKKATILSASGGVHGTGTPTGPLNFIDIDLHFKTLLGFLGVTDVKVVHAEASA
jgi:FMN-dependent NADH-azoreductase